MWEHEPELSKVLLTIVADEHQKKNTDVQQGKTKSKRIKRK